MLKTLPACLLAGLLAGCWPAPTSVLVTVEVAGSAQAPDQLAVSDFDPSGALVRDHAIDKPVLPGSLVLGVPDADQVLRVVVTGSPVRMVGAASIHVLPYQRSYGGIVLSAVTLDTDGDGVPDSVDNCASVANPDQRDQDQNGVAGTGTLTGSSVWSSAAVDLTAEGTLDWSQYAQVNALDVNRKSSGNARITLTPLVTTTPGVNTSFGVPASWSDGFPTATGSAVTSYVLCNGVGTGFTMTVPAGTTPRTVKLYLHLYSSTATINAHLSDSSAPDFNDTATWVSGFPNNIVYTLNFNSASALRMLTITFTQTVDSGGSMGVCAIT